MIFLNETHVTDDCDINDLVLNNYECIHCKSYSKHTGGVSIYISNRIKYKNVSIVEQNIAWYLSLEIIVNKVLTVLACVYLSASENKTEVLNSFNDWFEDISEGKQILICGDFNIDMLSNTSHKAKLKKICDDNGMQQLIENPTRVGRNSSTLIDLCITNINRGNVSAQVKIDDQITDHSILDIVIHGKSEQVKPKSREVTVWSGYDCNELWQSLEVEVCHWDSIRNGSVNDKMNWLLHTLSKCTEQFRKTKIIKPVPELFDRNLEEMRMKKNQMYKTASLSREPEADVKWHEYRVFKNEFKAKIREKKFELNQRKLNEAKGDMKRTWKVINSILNKEQSNLSYIKDGDTTYESDDQIVNMFNEYFVNSIIDINRNIPVVPFEHNIANPPATQFKFRGVSIAEIKSSIRQMKNNTDEYSLNANVLLDAMVVIGIQLAESINDSFSKGDFPQALKKSTIIPIQKKSGTVLINEHRPINMLPFLEKLIEKLAHTQFAEFIKGNNHLYTFQSGFREKHSCETAINDVLYDWKAAMNESLIIIAIFLDFQRAFETIEPKLLLYKLEFYFGVRGIELNWFRSYLTDRTQVVRICNVISSEINNRLGVPQGSILGPLLFILYINDLVNCLKYCSVKLFADDTLLYVTVNDLELGVRNVNEDLSRLFGVICQNELKLNVDKTKVMIITNKQIDRENVNIYINGCKLKIESEMKYLGVMIDDKLKFDKNADYLAKKIGKKTNVISRLRKQLTAGQKASLYKTIIEPHFTYCASVLFLSNETDLTRLQVLQNKCLRNVLDVDRYTSSEPMLKSLNLLSVKQLILFRTIIFIRKMIDKETPEYLSDRIMYKSETSTRTLRNNNDIVPVRATKACSQNSLFYRGIILYNTLPSDIRSGQSQRNFKRRLKNYMVENFR